MDTAPEITTLQPGPAIGIRAQLPVADLPSFFGGAFHELAACAADKVTGPPFAIYHAFDPDKIDVEAVMPLSAPVAPSGRVHPIDLPGGPAIQVRHTGPYEELGTAYVAIERWVEDHHRAKAESMREVYLTGPTAPPQERITLVIQPLQP